MRIFGGLEMRVRNYQKAAAGSDRMDTELPNAVVMPLLGLAGEIGSLLAELKKDIREGKQGDRTKEAVKEELGDILWYANAIGSRAGVDFQDEVLFANLKKIQNVHSDMNMAPAPLFYGGLRPGGEISELIRKRGSRIATTFNSYQEVARRSSRFSRRDPLLPFIIQIWSQSSQLLRQFDAKRSFKDQDKALIAEVLGDIMWYVANVAQVYELRLDDVARANLEKVQSRWPGVTRTRTPLFDDKPEVPDLERFPRVFTVDFIAKNKRVAVMSINGVIVGDPLTDNSYDIDGYRYHDALHLANMAILGWSPVMRKLFARKRRYDADVDENEDGARAAILEEAIVKITHSYAVALNQNEPLKGRNSVSFDLLKEIKGLTKGLEVHTCKYWEWEEAIIQGHRVFNKLRANNGGRVHVNLTERNIRFEKRRLAKGKKLRTRHRGA